METFKIRIIKSTSQDWYEVGEEYDVQEYNDFRYIVPSRPVFSILKTNCEIISNYTIEDAKPEYEPVKLGDRVTMCRNEYIVAVVWIKDKSYITLTNTANGNCWNEAVERDPNTLSLSLDQFKALCGSKDWQEVYKTLKPR